MNGSVNDQASVIARLRNSAETAEPPVVTLHGFGSDDGELTAIGRWANASLAAQEQKTDAEIGAAVAVFYSVVVSMITHF